MSRALSRAQSTYIFRIQSSVWRLPNYIDPPPPLRPASVSSPRTKGGGCTCTLAGGWGGGGGVNISEDARHWIGSRVFPAAVPCRVTFTVYNRLLLQGSLEFGCSKKLQNRRGLLYLFFFHGTFPRAFIKWMLGVKFPSSPVTVIPATQIPLNLVATCGGGGGW